MQTGLAGERTLTLRLLLQDLLALDGGWVDPHLQELLGTCKVDAVALGLQASLSENREIALAERTQAGLTFDGDRALSLGAQASLSLDGEVAEAKLL